MDKYDHYGDAARDMEHDVMETITELEEAVVEAAVKHGSSRVSGHSFNTTETRCPACRDQREFIKAVERLIKHRQVLALNIQEAKTTASVATD